jgi:hypothetical protein
MDKVHKRSESGSLGEARHSVLVTSVWGLHVHREHDGRASRTSMDQWTSVSCEHYTASLTVHLATNPWNPVCRYNLTIRNLKTR